MSPNARALVALTLAAGLSLSCHDPTGAIAGIKNGLTLPEGAANRDVSQLAGTYADPTSTQRLILAADGGFVLQYVYSSGTRDYAGQVARFDSLLVFSFNYAVLQSNWVTSGLIRADTVRMHQSMPSQYNEYEDLFFVRVRGP